MTPTDLRSVCFLIQNFHIDCLVLKEFVDVEENREYYYPCNVTAAIQYTPLEI